MEIYECGIIIQLWNRENADGYFRYVFSVS